MGLMHALMCVLVVGVSFEAAPTDGGSRRAQISRGKPRLDEGHAMLPAYSFENELDALPCRVPCQAMAVFSTAKPGEDGLWLQKLAPHLRNRLQRMWV